MLGRVAAEPDVWTDGSLVEDKVSGASSAGAGCFTYRCSRLWANWRWGHLDEDEGEDAVLFPGPLQSVQRLSSGVLFLLCRLMMVYILGLTILELFGMLAASWMTRLLLVLVSWLRMGILFCVLRRCSIFGVLQKGSFSAWSSWYLGWGWVVVAATPITCHDIELWPYSVGMLLKWVAFLYTLHWPQSGADLGVGGVSYVELLILYELWAGERLDLEKAVPRYRRVGRSISVSAVPFGPGTEIWRSRRYIGALFRALVAVPGGVRRFVSCEVGANHCRLRRFGWERCGHGLTSRPRDPGLAGFVWLSFWFCCCVIGWGVTPSVLFW